MTNGAIYCLHAQDIKFQSNRPIKQSYVIFISQMVSILYQSNTKEDAANEIGILIATSTNNGF